MKPASLAPASRSVLRFRRMLPWLVFGLGFFATTVVGALIIGYSEGTRWGVNEKRHLKMLLNITSLSPSLYARADYWWILKISMAIPVLGAIAAALTTRNRKTKTMVVVSSLRPPELYAARVVFLAIVLWLVLRVFQMVPGAMSMVLGAWGADFEEHYRVRYVIMQALTPIELGLAYSGLLSLLAIPLHRALITHRNLASWVELGSWYVVYGLLTGLLVQKLLFSFAISLAGLAMITAGHGMRHWKRLMLVSVLLFGIVHLAMSRLLPDWSLTSSVDHLIGRTADSYPFAVSMGPRHPFSIGQYLVGSITGRPAALGDTAAYNTEIYDEMYPATTGAMAIAAPVWSFTDVGRVGVVLTLLLIAAFCSLTTWLSRGIDRSPWVWSIYLLCVLQIYFLTQMPILGILFWSYAISYGFATLSVVALLSRFIRNRLSARGTSPAVIAS